MVAVVRTPPRRGLRVLLFALVPVLALGVGCSSDDEGSRSATSSDDSLVPASLPGITGTTPSTECGLLNPGLAGSDAFCAALPQIEAGTADIQADPEFCLAAATAPPSLAALDFWGRIDQVRLLQEYFTTLAPLAPDDLAEDTALLKEQADEYLAILERRDAGELTADEAEAEFRAYVAPYEETHPDLLPAWGAGVIVACTPGADSATSAPGD